MKKTCLLSEDSKHYLCCFYQILDGMAQGMTTAGYGRSISRNFVVQAIPHHRAAVQLSNNILRFSTGQAVRRLAQAIAAQRAQCIDELEGALSVCGQLTDPQMDLRLYQRRADLICREMCARMNASPEGNRLDAVFLRQMLPHCQGGVRMVENALRYDISGELAPILRAAAAQQRREAAQMRALLDRMRCQR